MADDTADETVTADSTNTATTVPVDNAPAGLVPAALLAPAVEAAVNQATVSADMDADLSGVSDY